MFSTIDEAERRVRRVFQRLNEITASWEEVDGRLKRLFAKGSAASGIETEGQDGATRLGAKHESPTPKGDAHD